MIGGGDLLTRAISGGGLSTRRQARCGQGLGMRVLLVAILCGCFLSSELLASVNPTFSWVRLAQRIPVRVKLDDRAFMRTSQHVGVGPIPDIALGAHG